MHCLAVELSSVICRLLTASRKAPVVTLAIIEMMIYVSIEMVPSVIPGSRPYERAI
jgi:hypothetical protein